MRKTNVFHQQLSPELVMKAIDKINRLFIDLIARIVYLIMVKVALSKVYLRRALI